MEKQRPDVIDWGTVGENAALRGINTLDPVDIARYWETNQSVSEGLMVDDIETVDELVENAKYNGRSLGYTLAISARSGPETGEFQGFVQFTADTRDELKHKIEETGLFQFLKDVVIWEVSYAKYPEAMPRQVASSVRQACVFLNNKLGRQGLYPRVAIIGSTDPVQNVSSLRVLAGAGFDPIGASPHRPVGIIRYSESDPNLDSVWLVNWNTLHHKLRQKAYPELERGYRGA